MVGKLTSSLIMTRCIKVQILNPSLEVYESTWERFCLRIQRLNAILEGFCKAILLLFFGGGSD